MTDKPKSPVEEEAQKHEDYLREECSCDEWNYELSESSAVTQGSHSFKLGAKWLAGELMRGSYITGGEISSPEVEVVEVEDIKRLMGEE